MNFTKMQGCGNDYIYVNCFEEQVPDPAALAIKLSDRHYGIGGDGLILIEPSDCADAYMHMFNLDGSEGSMCGNGIRCIAKYIYDHGIIPSDRRTAAIDTKAGLREVTLTLDDSGKVSEVTVDMGIARLTGGCPDTITIDRSLIGAADNGFARSLCRQSGAADMNNPPSSENGNTLQLSCISIDIGNPHAVYFLEDNPGLVEYLRSTMPADTTGILRNSDISKIGPLIEHHEHFPGSVNSEFISIVSPAEIDFRVWERGSGETLACGTGAAASVAAGCIAGKLEDDVLVHLTGGDLRIQYDRATGRCLMTGPATEVFTGRIDLQ